MNDVLNVKYFSLMSETHDEQSFWIELIMSFIYHFTVYVNICVTNCFCSLNRCLIDDIMIMTCYLVMMSLTDTMRSLTPGNRPDPACLFLCLWRGDVSAAWGTHTVAHYNTHTHTLIHSVLLQQVSGDNRMLVVSWSIFLRKQRE